MLALVPAADVCGVTTRLLVGVSSAPFFAVESVGFLFLSSAGVCLASLGAGMGGFGAFGFAFGSTLTFAAVATFAFASLSYSLSALLMRLLSS